MSTKTFHKYTSLILGILFLLFAILQYNDPDALLWIIIYGSVSALSFYSFRGYYNLLVLIILGLLYLFGAVYYWPPEFEGIFIGSSDTSNIELARESLGLMICFFVTVYYYVLSNKTADNIQEKE